MRVPIDYPEAEYRNHYFPFSRRRQVSLRVNLVLCQDEGSNGRGYSNEIKQRSDLKKVCCVFRYWSFVPLDTTDSDGREQIEVKVHYNNACMQAIHLI